MRTLVRLIALASSASALRTPPKRVQPGAPELALSRRALLPALLAAAATTTSSPLAARAADELEKHTADGYDVTYGAPAGWPVTEQELQGSRMLFVATDPKEPDSANVVLTFQPLAADYTSLGSFGTQELVGNSLMPKCVNGAGGFAGPDTGLCTLEADGIEGKMLGMETVKGAYAYDYTIVQTGQTPRRLRTLFAVQTQEGRGTRLVTLTAQCYESRYADLKPTFKKVLESYSSSLK